MATLEEMAQQTPGFGERIANLLTGGLYGGLSGRQSQWQEAERAKQMLMSEAANERYMQRYLERARMQNLLQGLQELGVTPTREQMAGGAEAIGTLLSQKQQEAMQQAAEGAAFARQSQGAASPAPDQPRAFKQAFYETGGKMQDILAQGEARQAAEDAAAAGVAKGFGIPVPLNAALGEPKGIVEKGRMKAQVEIPFAQRAAQAKARLAAAGQPVPPGDQEAVAALAQYEEELPTKQARTQQAAMDAFEAAVGSGDQAATMAAYNRLSPQDRKNPDIMRQAGVKMPLPAKDIAELRKAGERDKYAVNAANAIQALVGARDLPGVSTMSFNQLTRWAQDKRNRQFMETAQGRAINRVIQNYEGLISKTRKDLFGASLTGNELESSVQMFGNRDSADFLSRAMDNIDTIFQNNVPSEFSRQGFNVPESFLKDAEAARSKWNQVASGIKGWTSQYAPIEGLIGAPPAAGGTNAPARQNVIRYDRQGNRIQ